MSLQIRPFGEQDLNQVIQITLLAFQDVDHQVSLGKYPDRYFQYAYPGELCGRLGAARNVRPRGRKTAGAVGKSCAGPIHAFVNPGSGDFNIPRGSQLYENFLTRSGLTDLLSRDTRPTLRAPAGITSRYSLAIDYILVRLPDQHALNLHCDLWSSKKYSISKRHQGYLSDHDGIEIQITKV